jgi:hypothetical protein
MQTCKNTGFDDGCQLTTWYFCASNRVITIRLSARFQSCDKGRLGAID